MADVLQVNVVVVALHEIQGVVTVDGFGAILVFGDGSDVGHITGLTGGVGDPGCDVGGQVVVAVIGVGSGSSVACLGVDGQSGNSGIHSLDGGDGLVGQSLCSFLSGSNSGSLLLVGVGGGAVLSLGAALQELGGSQVVAVVGVVGVLHAVGLVLSTDVVSGVGQAVLHRLLVCACQRTQLHVSADVLLVGTEAVDGFQICLQAGEMVLLGSGLQISQLSGDGSLLLLVQGEACLSGSVGQSIDGLDVLLSGLLESVCPGGAFVLVIDLLVQGLGNVQTQEGCVGAVLAVEVVHSVVVEAVVLDGVDLVITHGDSGSAALQHTGAHNAVGDGSIGGEDHHDSQNNDHDGAEDLQFLGFGLGSELLFGEHFCFLRLAKLFLAGCAHWLSVPLIIYGLLRLERTICDIITHFPDTCKGEKRTRRKFIQKIYNIFSVSIKKEDCPRQNGGNP